MKATKKQNANKNQLDEDNSTGGIQTFFKPVQKTFAIQEKIPEAKKGDGAKMFYVGVLKEKLRAIRGEGAQEQQIEEESQIASGKVSPEQGHCSEVNGSELEIVPGGPYPACTDCARKDLEIEELRRMNSELTQQWKSLKLVHAKNAIHFTELYSKHSDLSKTVESINKPSAAEGEATTPHDVFTPNEVKFLQCMDPAKKNDCSFIHHCVKYAYKGDPAVLACKTLFGTAAWAGTSKTGEQVNHDAKAPLTPEKVRRIRALFADRISKCRIDSAQYEERMKETYVNKLIAAGIKNIAQNKKK